MSNEWAMLEIEDIQNASDWGREVVSASIEWHAARLKFLGLSVADVRKEAEARTALERLADAEDRLSRAVSSKAK